jgi:transposase
VREIFNAILYVNRTGIAWRYLPHDFPPHATVYGYFAAWSKESIFTELNYNLTGLVRDHHGRTAEPSASIMDTQSVKTSTNVPTDTQGIDAGKKIVGRKRGIITDTLGLLLAVTAASVSVSDNTIGKDLLTQATTTYPTLTKSWADAGFKTPSSNTALPSASTSRSSPKTHTSKDSASSNAARSSNAPSAGSCTTAASPATTKPAPTTPPLQRVKHFVASMSVIAHGA